MELTLVFESIDRCRTFLTSLQMFDAELIFAALTNKNFADVFLRVLSLVHQPVRLPGFSVEPKYPVTREVRRSGPHQTLAYAQQLTLELARVPLTQSVPRQHVNDLHLCRVPHTQR
jgi:hypothetical protein